LDTVLLVITENSGLICAHLAVAFLILAVYSFQSDRFSFSRFRVALFGSIYALTPACRVAWALSLSRMITVCFLAVKPESTGIPFGIALVLLTFGICFLSGDIKGLIHQTMISAAVFATLVLQGMFRSFYLEVETSLVLKIVSVYLGIFAVLFTLYQTLKGHERLLYLSGGTGREELERHFSSEEDEDSFLGRLKLKLKAGKQDDIGKETEVIKNNQE